MAAESTIPGKEKQKSTVFKKITIEDKELNKETPVSQITIGRAFNKITYAKIVLLDGSVSERDFALSSGDTFKPGNKITIELGYEGNIKSVFKGIIIKHGIKIRQKDRSLLIIEAKDEAIKLTANRKSAYYIDMTDTDVINKLASTLEAPNIEDTKITHKQLVQFDATDWDFIVTRAEANGMLVLTDDGKLVIKKPVTDSKPVLEATYGQNIWEFEAEMDARRHSKSVSGLSWDYTKQEIEKVDAVAGSSTAPTVSGIASALSSGVTLSDLGNVLGAEVILSHTGYLSNEQLQSWTDAHSMRNKLSRAIGRVRIAGDASVKPGDVIKLIGVGSQFNGNVFVSGVLHHYEGSWQTDIQFGWKEDWFYHKEKIMEKPASGLVPGVNGLQIGKVIEVSDKETGQYLVKVYIATFTSGQEGMWARVASLDAGADHGIYFRPQIDDEVILGFLNDDPREPIVLGYVPSKDGNTSPLPEKENELQYGIITKNGLRLVFDDTNKKMTLSVKADSGEKTITINDKSGAMELKDENNNSIKMDASGITISSDKLVTIKGKTVMIN